MNTLLTLLSHLPTNHMKHNVEYTYPLLWAQSLQALNTHTIQGFYNKLLKNGLSPKTIKSIHGMLHKALDIAVKLGYINFNPASFCELPRMEKKDIKLLTEQNIKDFIKELEKEPF